MKYILYFFIFSYSACYSQDSLKIQKLIEQALDYEQSGDLDNAISTHLKVLSINPKSYQSANSIAGLYGLEGKFGDEIT